jgi:hypothetical protein
MEKAVLISVSTAFFYDIKNNLLSLRGIICMLKESNKTS